MEGHPRREEERRDHVYLYAARTQEKFSNLVAGGGKYVGNGTLDVALYLPGGRRLAGEMTAQLQLTHENGRQTLALMQGIDQRSTSSELQIGEVLTQIQKGSQCIMTASATGDKILQNIEKIDQNLASNDLKIHHALARIEQVNGEILAGTQENNQISAHASTQTVEMLGILREMKEISRSMDLQRIGYAMQDAARGMDNVTDYVRDKVGTLPYMQFANTAATATAAPVPFTRGK
jgi:hypothetical protein